MMGIFQNMTIKNKLIVIVFLVTMLTMSAFFIMDVVNDINRLRVELINSTDMTAKLIGEYCVPPLTFSDTQGADDVLERLESLPDIIDGYLYDDNGEPFAAYGDNPGTSLPLPNEAISGTFEENILHIVQPIIFRDQYYGTLYLRVSTASLDTDIKEHFATMLSLLIGLLVLSYFLTVWLQRYISQPIESLTHVTKKIMMDGDYTVRADETSTDEVGELCRGFNKMLEQIHRREVERDSAGQALRESENRLKAVLDNSTTIIFLKDMQGRYILVNKQFERQVQLTSEDLIGKTDYDLFDYEHANQLKKNDQTVIENLAPMEYEENIPFPDGLHTFITVKFPIFLRENTPYAVGGVATDITERIKAESERRTLEGQLQKAQRMESIGRLAGGIAHDFNNILTGMMGFAELLNMKFQGENNLEGEASEVIIKGIERASGLTRQLLGFARGGKYHPVPINVNDVIQDTLKVSEKIFEKKITVHMEMEENLRSIEADKHQLDQVLTNLIINARDAMPNGGVLTVKTENIILDNQAVQTYLDVAPGIYIRVTLTDTGVGMSPEVREHIFEPFYTTKGEGRGTGLGLAMVYGIIKNHHGHITCYSEPGTGTAFNLYFPVTDKTIDGPEKDKVILTGDGTILVVDDEPSIREALKHQLESLGYQVILAGDGIQGVDIYKEHHQNIDLVLLDMIMPNMAGKETFRALQTVNPQVRVLLISGFSKDDRTSELINSGVRGFVQKPFRRHELAQKIQDAIQ